MKKVEPAIILLALAAFLASLMGGFIDVGSWAVPPGTGAFEGLFYYQTSTLAHGILGLLVLAGLAVAIYRKQVVQLPQSRILFFLGLFLGLMALSVGLSAYHMLSLWSLAEWAMFGTAFVAVCAVAGRWNGLRILCGAFVLGCFFVALSGFREYITQNDPTWRIMHYWQDPNALAGLLVLGLLTAIGLSFTVSRSKAVGLLLMAGVIGSALLLTQSKGGLVAAFAGLLCLFIAIGFYSRDQAGRRLGNLALPVVLIVVLTPLVQSMQRGSTARPQPPPAAAAIAPQPAPASQPANSAPTPLGRLLNPASTAEQSAQFRFNLWNGCLWLIKQNPAGYGIGTYRFQSTKPGNTSETKLAHNSYLQLAVEINPIGALAFVVFLFLCAFEMLRASSHLPERQNLFRMGVLAALLASAVHNAFDCDFFFTGIALPFFMLLGVGLNLSSDAILPELMRTPVKFVLGGVGGAASLFLVYAGIVQLKLEWLRGDFATGSQTTSDDAEALRSLCPFDWQVWYESVGAATSTQQQQQFAQEAIDNGPTTTDYHRLAQVDMRIGASGEAIAALDKSFKLDPNNLENLFTKLQIQEKSDIPGAIETAKRMVGVESTTYFTTRALPQVVPTQTYEARQFLASQTSDPAAKAHMLRPAVQGFVDFSTQTVPEILELSSVGASTFGSPSEAEAKLTGAIQSAKDLQAAYLATGDKGDADWAAGALSTLEAAEASLGKSLSSSR